MTETIQRAEGRGQRAEAPEGGTPNPLRHWPVIRPIQDNREAMSIHALARAEGHNISQPSHVVEIDGQIVGAVGFTAIPIVRYWISETVKPRQSLEILAAAENIQTAAGAETLFAMFNPGSPFEAVAEKLGYTAMGVTKIVVKSVRGEELRAGRPRSDAMPDAKPQAGGPPALQGGSNG